MRKILFLQFTNPTSYPPLEHCALILKSQGWAIYFLGVHRRDGGNFLFPQALVGGLELLTAPAPGWRQKFFFLYFQVWAVLRALRQQPSWIYVSDVMATPAGLLLSLIGFSVAYHEHDSPDRVSRSIFEKVLLLCRNSLAKRTLFNVLPQQKRCTLFQESTGSKRPVLCVWNCPRIDEIPSLPCSARTPLEPLGIYYHGTINLTRIPVTLIEAAGATGLRIRLRIVGYETIGSVGASEILRQAADRFAPNLQLELVGPKTRQQLFSQMDGMHLGWIAFNEDSVDLNLRHLAGASNKAFDYLAAGLPLMVNSSPEWLELFVMPGLALACDCKSSKSIQKSLMWAFSNRQKLAEMGEAGRLRIKKEWNYESQLRPVLARFYAENEFGLPAEKQASCSNLAP